MVFEGTPVSRHARRLGFAVMVATLSTPLAGRAAAPLVATRSRAAPSTTRRRGSPGSRGLPPSTLALPNAESYCSTLNLGGTGWRLPTTRELETIVDPTVSGPAIDPTAFPGTPSDYFWTATPYAPTAGDGWLVDFVDGSVAFVQTTYVSNVRCVR